MFTERSDLVADDDPVRGYGVAVTPGREGPLVFVAGYGEPNRLYARDGDRFVDTACGIVADGTRHGMACARPTSTLTAARKCTSTTVPRASTAAATRTSF